MYDSSGYINAITYCFYRFVYIIPLQISLYLDGVRLNTKDPSLFANTLLVLRYNHKMTGSEGSFRCVVLDQGEAIVQVKVISKSQAIFSQY